MPFYADEFYLVIRRWFLDIPHPPGFRIPAGHYHHWNSFCQAAFQTGPPGADSVWEGSGFLKVGRSSDSSSYSKSHFDRPACAIAPVDRLSVTGIVIQSLSKYDKLKAKKYRTCLAGRHRTPICEFQSCGKHQNAESSILG